EQALDGARKAYGEEHPVTATAYHNLGMVLHQQGERKAAWDHLSKALAIRERVLGAAHPSTAATQLERAIILLGQGRPRDSIQEAERGLAAYRETLGDEHPQTVHAMLVVGFVRQFLGEYEQARPLLEKSLSVQLKLSRDLLPTLSEAEALAYVGRTD